MRLSELINEAPIAGYDTFGDFEKSSSYRDKRDRHLVTDERAIERTKKKFLNTPHDLYFYFINSPEANKHTEVGKVNLQWISNNLGDDVAEKIEQVEDDAIHFVFTNNKGAERFMMTPWIMAHRMAHSLQRAEIGNTRSDMYGYQNPYFREAHEKLIESLLEVLREGYGLNVMSQNISGVMSNRRDQLILKHFAQQVCTFKSARDKKIRDWFEIVNELFAQWATTENIKFNRPPSVLKLGKAGEARIADSDYANQILDSLSRDMDYYFDAALGAAYGDIYVM